MRRRISDALDFHEVSAAGLRSALDVLVLMADAAAIAAARLTAAVAKIGCRPRVTRHGGATRTARSELR